MFSRKKASESKKKLSLHPADFVFFDFKKNKIKNRSNKTKIWKIVFKIRKHIF